MWIYWLNKKQEQTGVHARARTHTQTGGVKASVIKVHNGWRKLQQRLREPLCCDWLLAARVPANSVPPPCSQHSHSMFAASL